MITIELSEITQTTGHNRSCPNIARKLIQDGAAPSTEIDFIRDGKRSFPVNTLAWWSKVQHTQG